LTPRSLYALSDTRHRGAAVYDEFAKIAFVIAVLIVAGIVLYHFTVYVLPWLLLAVAAIAVVWFFFWQRSTRRSTHPWD
jgi:Flp pilus assembly protein TadB